jgi:signal transduction histidine kinase
MDPDDLVAAVAHEVKTPLAVLRGYAELLSRGANEDVREQAPAAILEAAERLGRAVDDLLLVFEIDSGTVERDWEAVELRALLPDGNGELPRVLGDPSLLGHALSAVLNGSPVSVTAAGKLVAIAADDVPASRLELYLARRIAELHGGRLHEHDGGVVLTLLAA